MSSSICIIGAGLAGSECAWQLAKRGINVTLVEMRPKKLSPAHHGDKPAELVCSNSLRSNDPLNAVGLLKEEMLALDSLIIQSAHRAKVPAGSALAVDRDVFSAEVLTGLKSSGRVAFVNDVVTHLEKNPKALTVHLESGRSLTCQHAVIATGPLTDEKLAAWIREETGVDSLYFYDSIAPIVSHDSIDMNIAFRASRYDKGDAGEGDYINCPMSKTEYENFIAAIQSAELVAVHDFDKAQFFDGCLPVEEMVRRGPETLRFGPMKPVGLRRGGVSPPEIVVADNGVDTNTDEGTNTGGGTPPLQELHAVVQLRQDNVHGSLYNMVGFQTRLKYGEQQRIFKMIPGLGHAEFVRLGSMHRNTYLCSPKLLGPGMEMVNLPGVHFAGQITGCEGYVESAAVGLYVGMVLGRTGGVTPPLRCPPATTALGALVNHLLHGDADHYQPMNINFGLFEPLSVRAKKNEKKSAYVERARLEFREWYDESLG